MLPVHEESISDVQDALVESNTTIADDIDTSKDDTIDLKHELAESSMLAWLLGIGIPMIKVGIELGTVDTGVITSSKSSKFSHANCDYVVAPNFFTSSELGIFLL